MLKPAGTFSSQLQLAKRKAEELEDFGETTSESAPKLPKTDVDEGTALVRSFLDEWRSRAEGGTEEEQLKALHSIADEYKSKFADNTWIQSVLAAL